MKLKNFFSRQSEFQVLCFFKRTLQKLLSSPHLILRKVSVCCLRQLVQREAKEVREHAQTLVPQGIMNNMGRSNAESGLPETGLEGALLAMLDVETDVKLKLDIKVGFFFIRYELEITYK